MTKELKNCCKQTIAIVSKNLEDGKGAICTCQDICCANIITICKKDGEIIITEKED